VFVTLPTRPLIPLWLAVIVAAASGPVLALGFPGTGWWPLTFVGVAMVLVCLIGRRIGGSILVGYASGLSFYLFLVSWTSLYLGPLPWIALSIAEGAFYAAGCVLITLAYRWVPRAWPGRWGRVLLLPAVVAGCWTAREGFSSVWPYGGFPWGRLAESLSESPFAPLVAWVGISGLSFLVVLIVAVIVQCVLESRVRPEWRLRPAWRVTVAVGVIAVILAVPAWPALTRGSTRIAAVQGDGPAGYFQDAPAGAVENSQISETLSLVGRTKTDLVVWPENGADVDPTRNAQSAADLDYLSKALHAPLVVGTITYRHGKYYNTSLLWEAGKGAVDYYDKRHPVPFGEYVPDRAFWRPFAPQLIDLIGRNYTPGTRKNTFDIRGMTAGISICFDIADDQLFTDMMTGGAQVILAQTNNADFGRTDENEQQLAIARLRAIEGARSLVNISTVGTSQIIAPNGSTIEAIPAYKPGVLNAVVPLGTTTTPAVLDSLGVELLVSGLGVGAVIVARITTRGSGGNRRARRQ
jgi:apolipoprotein N-acyltransferase